MLRFRGAAQRLSEAPICVVIAVSNYAYPGSASGVLLLDNKFTIQRYVATNRCPFNKSHTRPAT